MLAMVAAGISIPVNTGYDLQGGVTTAFLDRVLAAAINTGILPNKFTATVIHDDTDLGLTVKIDVGVEIEHLSFFTEEGQYHQIGLAGDFTGTLTITTTLTEWSFTSVIGGYTDPALSDETTLPFSGNFRATGEVTFVNVSGSNMVQIGFSGLESFDFQQIGPLQPGPALTEVVRRVAERIGVVALRTQVKFGPLGGLPGSLPAPSDAILPTASGVLGSIDLKVVEGSSAGLTDEIQVVVQSQQNWDKNCTTLSRRQ